MPAPSTIVTFRDAEGDEFPIRLPGEYDPYEEAQEAASSASKQLNEMEERGEMKPTHPVKVCGIEVFNSLA